MKDFFTRYRESRKHHYIIPGIFGLVCGFAIVAQMSGTPIDLRTLQANVLEANTPKVIYSADLLLEQSGGTLMLRIGKDAADIDTLYFTLLGDPSVISALSPLDAITTIESSEPGMYLVKVSLGRSLRAGDIITTLRATLSGETSLALLDAGFTSGGVTYHLSAEN